MVTAAEACALIDELLAADAGLKKQVRARTAVRPLTKPSRAGRGR